MQIDISMKTEMRGKVHQQGKMLRLCSSSSFVSDSLHIPQPQWVPEGLRHGATGKRAFFHLHTRARHQPGWTFITPSKLWVLQSWTSAEGQGRSGPREEAVAGGGQAVVIATPAVDQQLWYSVTWAFCTPPAGFEKSKGWEALRILIYTVCSKLCF